ncbi:head completion/stabilization protein [Photorhabdus tasmaniensis]|uniref:Head completion protein n=1 Tax=Photorhabdus tasmaniensis TaxID=1004159 RepID=A0ABX0GDP1_9GAMM|nr:head completion/stabilization protein [Photorhabdus tasmaniensis]NHB87182.1 head completion protein [Photorhabdus tasmaniensis]
MTAPSLGFSGKPIDYQHTPIINGVDFWPDLDLAEFQRARTIPPELPADTAGQAILAAIAEINDSLTEVVEYWCSRGVSRACDVPGAKMGDENQLTAQYRKAVYARAKADLMGEFAIIGRRETHPGQESTDSRGNLLAETASVLRNMQKLPRVGVYLL